MRYMLLQQAGGGSWMVFDTAHSIEIKTFTDKFAREYATELCGVLNCGQGVLDEALTSPDKMRELFSPVRGDATRRKVLQRTVPSGGEEG